MLWILNLSDGTHSLLDIAQRSGLPFNLIAETATALEDADLLAAAGSAAPVDGEGGQQP
jgi:aminopeptidase-like protein